MSTNAVSGIYSHSIRPLLPSTDPLKLGTNVPVYGTVGAVVLTNGERYYMLTDKRGTVSFMPACVIETMGDKK